MIGHGSSAPDAYIQESRWKAGELEEQHLIGEGVCDDAFVLSNIWCDCLVACRRKQMQLWDLASRALLIAACGTIAPQFHRTKVEGQQQRSPPRFEGRCDKTAAITRVPPSSRCGIMTR